MLSLTNVPYVCDSNLQREEVTCQRCRGMDVNGRFEHHLSVCMPSVLTNVQENRIIPNLSAVIAYILNAWETLNSQLSEILQTYGYQA